MIVVECSNCFEFFVIPLNVLPSEGASVECPLCHVVGTYPKIAAS